MDVHLGQSMGKRQGDSIPFLNTPLSPNVLGFTNLEALQIPSFLVFMETQLHSHDCLIKSMAIED